MHGDCFVIMKAGLQPAGELSDHSTYHGGEHAEVAGGVVGGAAAVQRDAELRAADALDEAAEAGDADDLDEGERHGDGGRHEHRVHGVVRHALPDARLVVDGADAVLLQVRARADTAQHQQLRAPQRARRQDHLVLGASPSSPQVHVVLHAHRVREHHTVRHGFRRPLCMTQTMQQIADACMPVW